MRSLILLAVPLAACGSGNDAGGNSSAAGGFAGGFRAQYRTQFVAQCEAAAKKAAGGAPLNFAPICGCAADKLLASKSPTELMTGPSEQEQVALMRQCVTEHPPTAAG